MRYEGFVKKITDDIARNGQVRIMEMPELDLYLDQIAKFMDDKLSIYKKEEKDKILTKTMINNYSKNNIIPKPVNKKYSRQHLMLLIMIYHMKSILSMKDMELLMKPLIENYNSELEDKIDIEDIYFILQEIQREELDSVKKYIADSTESVKEYLKEINMQDDDILEVFMLITLLTNRANIQKNIAEKLVAEFFTKEKAETKKDKNKQEKKKVKEIKPSTK